MSRKADVCLILEGTYPYVSGGVSTWTHELINNQSYLTFHIVAILPKDEEVEMKYSLPNNVVGVTEIRLQELPMSITKSSKSMERLEEFFNEITIGSAGLDTLESVMDYLDSFIGRPGGYQLIDSEASWELLVSMYEKSFSESSFLDYFWSWRAIAGSLFSVLLADLPDAGVYHALSTGYAGVMAARAKIEKKRPVFITEHGIYTNERRIEIASADWLDEAIIRSLTVDKTRRSLKDLWIDTFTNYSRMAYQASDQIVTLYKGNQVIQLSDGAAPEKMHVIRNGVDIENFANIQKRPSETPTIALIGRVVPIKDIKSFIRCCAILRDQMQDLKVYIMGPTDEDEEYYEECLEIVDYLSLDDVIQFTGQVNVIEYLGEIDLIVMTSISEAQPLVILEAGASGIPCVATNVGACEEMIMGHEDEEPQLGAGGAVVPLGEPASTAQEVLRLLGDKAYYNECSNAIKQRVFTYYNKDLQNEEYRHLYDGYLADSSNGKRSA